MNEGDEGRILSLLSLCQKAGMLASGETPCESAIRSGKARLVIMSKDASAGTMKKFSNRCHYYEVPLVVLPFDKERIGHAVGKKLRSCAAICEEGFAKRIIEYQENIEEVGIEFERWKNNSGKN